jgi:hypothetical protein
LLRTVKLVAPAGAGLPQTATATTAGSQTGATLRATELDREIDRELDDEQCMDPPDLDGFGWTATGS